MLRRRTAIREEGGAAAPRSDVGATFVEILISLVLLGTVLIATLTAMRTTIIATSIERDHSKAQQWLQSAIGIIEDVDFGDCSDVALSGPQIEAAYQDAIDDPVTGAQQPYNFVGATIDVFEPDVWDGSQWVAFGDQSQCLDDELLRQQRVTVEVRSPDGNIIESVQLVKRDA